MIVKIGRMILGAASADHIMASGPWPRKQAGHMTAPDRGVISRKSPCNAGAVHTWFISAADVPGRPGVDRFRPAKRHGLHGCPLARATDEHGWAPYRRHVVPCIHWGNRHPGQARHGAIPMIRAHPWPRSGICVIRVSCQDGSDHPQVGWAHPPHYGILNRTAVGLTRNLLAPSEIP